MLRSVYAFLAAFGAFGVLAFATLFVLQVIGFFANIVQIALFALSNPTMAMIQADGVLWAAKILGIFVPPLGGIMGIYGMF